MLICDKENLNPVTNKNCISRLSRYKSALYHFRDLGFNKIFSSYLSQVVGVTSTQIRKDFSLFKITGNKRGGYSVDLLITSLNNILGKNETHKVILIGVGNLGSALMNYKGFSREGFQLVAAFDIDPAKISKKVEIPIYPLHEIFNIVKEHEIQFGVISTPAMVAQSVFDLMVDAGIRGVLNFAPCCLTTTDNRVFVNNVNLELELEQLVYFAKLKNKMVLFDRDLKDSSSASNDPLVENPDSGDYSNVVEL